MVLVVAALLAGVAGAVEPEGGVLVVPPGEGAFKWKRVKPGVWKAELVIKTGESETYRETRILDLRNYAGPGLILFVK